MAYSLIILLYLYIALAITVILYQPRTLANIMFALYTLSAAIATAGYLVVGTTTDSAAAKTFAFMTIIVRSWSFLLFLPYILVGLYFEPVLRRYWRAVRALGLACLAIASMVMAALLSNDVQVYRAKTGFVLRPIMYDADPFWLLGTLAIMGNLVPLIVIMMAALRFRRLSLWRGAVPLTLVSLAHLLIPTVAPVAGAHLAVTVAALGFLPSVLLLTGLVVRAARRVPLDVLIQTSLTNYTEGVIVMRSDHTVLWQNAQVMHWLGSRPVGMVAPPHIFDLLHGTPLIAPVRHMLDMGPQTGEAEILVSGEEHVLQLRLQPLDHVRYLPGALLLILTDVTALRMRRNLEERRRELLALSTISADISSALELEQVLTRSLQQISALTRMDAAAVYLFDADQPEYGTLAKSLILNKTPVPIPERMAFESGGASAEVLHIRKAIFIPDAQNTLFQNYMLKYGIAAGAIIPLVARDRVIGMLYLAYLGVHTFETLEMTLLESVARQLAVAVENARLINRERQQRQIAEALREVASVLSTKSLDEALEVLLAQLIAILPFDRASVLLAAEPGLLRVGAQIGFTDVTKLKPLAEVRVEIAQFPYLQKIFSDHTSQLVPDTTIDPHWKDGDFVYHSWMGVPLKTRDRVLGCLSIAHDSPGQFTQADLEIATAFAAQVVVAVENTQLFQTEQRRRVQAEILQEASYSLVTAASLPDALDLSLKHLARVLTFGRAHIALIAPDGATWHSPTSYPPANPFPPDYVVPVSRYPLFQEICETRRPVLITDTREDKRWRPAEFSPHEIRCWIGAPLVVGDRVIGLLNIDHYEPNAFGADEFQICQVFANQIGAAVQNFRLQAETRHQNRALNAINTILTTSNEALTRHDLLNVSLERVLDALGLHGGAIHQRDNNAQKLRLRVSSGLPPAVIDHLRETPLARQLPTIALPNGEAYTFFSVPLISHGDEIGMLSIYQNGQAPLRADLRDLLAKIGHQLGVVMDNATLFEEVSHRLEQLRLVNEVSRYATAILSVNNLIEGVAEKLFARLHYDTLGLIQVDGPKLALHAFFTHGQTPPDGALAARHTAPDSVAAQAVRSSTPVRRNYVDDQTASPGCALAVPLLLADEVIGALVVERHGQDSITQIDLDVLEPLAGQLAISVSNARLFETIRQQAAELEIRVETRTTEIRQQKERTEAILRSVADAVIVFDLNEQVIMTNPVANALFDDYDLIHNLGGRIRTLVANILTPDQTTDGSTDDSTEIIELGEVTLQAKASRVVEDAKVLGTVVVLRDITRQRELDRLKDLFVSTVSHELRTPLANLKLYLSLLNQGRPERRANYMDVMGREIGRLSRLIDDLLQISRLQSQRHDERPKIREEIDLAQMINTIVEDNKVRAEQEQVTLLQEHPAEPLPVIQGDPDQLVRAFTNLTSNAINYTPAGGRVIIRTRVKSSQHNQPEWVIIEVIDTGIGIPASEVPMIFDRFYRGSNVDPGIPGTGLGLAIIKDIVDLHEGSIEVESEEGRGSTFRLTLPVEHTPK